MKRVAPLLAVLLALVMPAGASDTTTLVREWYAALTSGGDEEIAARIADDAVFALEDIGVEQTKAEFVAALDEWRDAISGGSVDHRVESATPAGAVAIVCYRFPGNEMMMREQFDFADGLIAKSTQAQMADNCDGF